MPEITLREEISRPAMTSSLTALALAPGVLNTTTPVSLHLSTGMLLTPAPARAMASRLSGSSISCMAADRTITPVAVDRSSVTVYLAASKRAVPQAAILFSVQIFILAPYPFLALCPTGTGSCSNWWRRFSGERDQPLAFSNSRMNATSFSTPSMGMAL